jgi:ABC-type sulfate transport system permease subunit
MIPALAIMTVLLLVPFVLIFTEALSHGRDAARQALIAPKHGPRYG